MNWEEKYENLCGYLDRSEDSEEEKKLELQNYLMEECLANGSMDDRYYCALRCLYGIGMEPNLEMAEKLLSDPTDGLPDLKGFANIIPDLDFVVFGDKDVFHSSEEVKAAEQKLLQIENELQEIEHKFEAENEDEAISVDYEKYLRDKHESLEEKIPKILKKLALSCFYLFNKADESTLVKEIFYQEQIGRAGMRAVKKLLLEKYDKNVLNPCHKPEKALNYLNKMAEMPGDTYGQLPYGDLVRYLKAYCLEKGIGEEKNIDAAIEAYEGYAVNIQGAYEGNAFYRIAQLTNDKAQKEEWLQKAQEYHCPKAIAFNKYCKDFEGKNPQSLTQATKKYVLGNCVTFPYWKPEMNWDKIPDFEKALAKRLAETEMVSCVAYKEEIDSPIYEYEEGYFGMEESYGKYNEFPSNLYLALEFCCPLKQQDGSDESSVEKANYLLKKDEDVKTLEDLAKLSSPMDYLKIILEENERGLYKAEKLVQASKSYMVAHSKLLLEYNDGHEEYQNSAKIFEEISDLDDQGDIFYNLSLLDCHPLRYEDVKVEHSLEKDASCTGCSFQYCPFKLAAYLKYQSNIIKGIEGKEKLPISEPLYAEWIKRKYDFIISFDELDFFTLSDTELEKAKKLAEAGLVYLSKDGERIIHYFGNYLSSSSTLVKLDNNLSCNPCEVKREKIKPEDSYGLKLVKAAAIWSYIKAKKITKEMLKKQLLSGLFRTVSTLMNPHINFFYGVIKGDLDNSNWAKEKVKNAVKDNFKVEEFSLKRFCEDIRNEKIVFTPIANLDSEVQVAEQEKNKRNFKPGRESNAAYTTNKHEANEQEADDSKNKKVIYMITALSGEVDSVTLDTLCNVLRSKYVILCGNEKEVNAFLKQDQKLQWLFNSNIIEFQGKPEWQDEYEKFKDSLPEKLKNTIRYNDVELRNKFRSFFQDQQLPLESSEIAPYLRDCCVVKNSLELPSTPSIADVEKEWDKLIGLDQVKKQWKRFKNLIEYNKMAQDAGKKPVLENMHFIFQGNPGVGKTRVARLMAKTLFRIGVIRKEMPVEVARKDLVAEHIGQTAVKTAKVIEQAKGGVLFIDEAYALNSGDNFGQEAINTLIKAMEDYKDSLIVIFAGYKKVEADSQEKASQDKAMDMETFMNMNPGLKSRISFNLDFDDYKPEELAEMFIHKLQEHGLKCFDENAIREKVVVMVEKAENKEGKQFGYGRYIDQLFLGTMLNHSDRCLDSNGNKDEAYLIRAEEICLPYMKE